jgi:tetratricopeptide (TPR) repeat protein
MNTILLYAVDPAKNKPRDMEQIHRFAEQMNGIYNIFRFDFAVEEYPGTLSTGKDGRYSVKKMQNAILQSMSKGWLFFLIFTCPVNQINSEEFSEILGNLRRLKKAGVRVWFENKGGIQPLLGDVARMFARINDSIPAPEIDQEKLAGMALGIFQQGNEAAAKGNLPLAEALYNRALTIQRKLVLAKHDRYVEGLAPICQELGTVLLRTRRFQPAENLYQQALKVNEEVMEKKGIKPTADMAGTHNNLGILYLSTDRFDEAITQFRAAVDIYEPLLEDPALAENPDKLSNMRCALADTRGNEANLLNRQKKTDEAKQVYQRTLEDLRAYIAESSDNAAYKNRFTTLATAFAAVYMQNREVKPALELFTENEKIFEELVGVNKEAAEPLQAQNFYNEFQACRMDKQPEKAKEYWDRTKEICDRYPDNAICRHLVEIMNVERDAAAKRQTAAAEDAAKKAEEMLNAGNRQGAANALRAAATLYHGLPGSESQLKSADYYHQLGNLLWDAGNITQAEVCFTNEAAISRMVAESDPEHRPELALALFHLGRFQDEAKDQPDNEALKEALKVAESCRDKSETAQEVFENLSDGAFDLDGETSGDAEETAEEDPLSAEEDPLSGEEKQDGAPEA